ncbi:MAG: O-acetyl-ADP-ribose deacetylase [Victivallales bacterium]|nr:O-acetyl-ADP-ribose deacetylase [Victivallales bacterium]
MEISIVYGDITELNVDAIVNAANCSLLGGGGVDGAIHSKAGSGLLEECKTFNGCNTGEAVITKGYKLPASYVIHTPGPVWKGGNSNESLLLKNCYKNSLKIAEEKKLDSIAFPAISTGVYRFPLEKAANIAVDAVSKWEGEFPRKVIFCCFLKNIKDMYDKIVKNYK